MELIILALAELLVLVFAGVIALLVELALWLVALITWLYVGLGKTIRSRPTLLSSNNRKRLFMGTVTLGGITLTSFLSLFVLNTFFFGKTASFIARSISGNTHTTILFDVAEGNLFKGQINLTDLKVMGGKTRDEKYSVQIETLKLDVDMRSLISPTSRFTNFEISGLVGDIWQQASKPTNTQSIPRTNNIVPRKRYEVSSLRVLNAELTLHKGGHSPLLLEIERFESNPLRSHFAVFDLMFRSTLRGNINGQKMRIETSQRENEEASVWHFETMPVEPLALYLNSPPFSWLDGGTVDIRIDETWRQNDTPELDLKWHVILDGVRLRTPKETGFLSQKLIEPVAGFVNGFDKPIDLEFTFTVRENEFETKSNLAAAGLWQALSESFIKTLAQQSDREPNEVLNRLKTAGKRFKFFINEKEVTKRDGSK